MADGTLIVLEGADGSGKSTQFRLLCQRFDTLGKPYRHLAFPQYDKPSSALIRMYLNGEFGSRPADVNPYAASVFYAVDRYAAWKQGWGDFYRGGGLVLSDRYTTSNAVHQGGKLPPTEQPGFFDWLTDLEYDKLHLPRPNLVIWFDMPTEQSVHLLRARETATHTKGDIHEADADYLALCHQTALRAARHSGWKRVPCVDTNGVLRSIDAIHAEVWKIILETIPTLLDAP